ncbi:MAG: hypothetical protein RLZZ28_1364 [Bacteroidota bacterium]|jgi:hypothetical protein
MYKIFTKHTRPFWWLFAIVGAILLLMEQKLTTYHIDAMVVFSANFFLCLVSIGNILFQEKNLSNPNPNAVIRGVMAATFIKLFVLAAAALIYLFAAGENRSVNAVFLGMGLYIAYTWLEVRVSLKMNPKK